MAIIESHPFLHFGRESEKNLPECLWFLTCSSSQHLRNTARLGGQKPALVCPSTVTTLTPEKTNIHVKSQSYAFDCTNPTLQQAPTPSSQSLPREPERLMVRAEVSPCRAYAATHAQARAHTHKHSIPCEGGQSCDLSLEQQISAPWTETPRSNTGEEEEEERRNFSAWGILRQTPNTDMCHV